MNFDPLQEFNILAFSVDSDYDALNDEPAASEGIARFGNTDNFRFGEQGLHGDANYDNYKFDDVKPKPDNYTLDDSTHSLAEVDPMFANNSLIGDLGHDYATRIYDKNNMRGTNNKYLPRFASNHVLPTSVSPKTKPRIRLPLKPSVTIASIDTFAKLRKLDTKKSKRKSISEDHTRKPKLKTHFYMNKHKSTSAISSSMPAMSTFFTQRKKTTTANSPINFENEMNKLFDFPDIPHDTPVEPPSSLFAYSKNLDLSLDIKLNDEDPIYDDDLFRTEFLESINFT